MSKTYLLVLGAPRSGTTLLTAMIGRHDHVAMLNEDFYYGVDNVVSKPIVGNKLCIPNQIELDERKPRWLRLLGPSVHNYLYRRGFFTRRPESSRSINDYLNRDEPTKVIGIVRDGNAVISSIMRRGEQTFDTAAHRWRRSIEILHTLHRRLGSNLLLLRFEDLVQTPKATMQRIADFLGVPFQRQMLEGYAYTPIYSNQGIDPERAAPHRNDGIDHNLPSRFPETLTLYEELAQEARAVPA